MIIETWLGDITTLAVDAIVNAANDRLAPGGGVCGAIHRAAGPQLALECAEVGPCAHGDARATAGYRLPARWVIHAVGPCGTAAATTRPGAARLRVPPRSVELAGELGVWSIAFPAISTGDGTGPLPTRPRGLPRRPSAR